MKRISFILLALSIAYCLPISARVITQLEAQATALDLVGNLDGSDFAQFSNVVITKVSETDGSTPVLYIVNTYNRSLTLGHFVILDATTGNALAHGDGLLDQANIPDAMQLLLDYYQEQIECTLSQGSGGESVRKNTMMTSNVPVVKVGPLLTAEWGQGAPYNDQCVFKNRMTQTFSRCPSGCGATALAQVMHKWRFPEASPSLSGRYSDTLQFEVPDLPSRLFDWENMLDSYTGEHSAAQDSAVAWLMRYTGQAQEMNYGVTSSGSSARRIVNALDSFGYNASWWIRSQTDSVTWVQKMISELDSGRPIIYSAGDTSNYATDSVNYFHLFDVDGYETYADGLTKFHINWGWNGNGNGDFVLDYFNNTVSQIGQNHLWNVNQQMIVDIYPIVPQPPEVSVDSTALSFEEFTGYTKSSFFTVRGDWLDQDIELSITGDDGGVFSFSNSTRITTMTITPDQAHCKKVTVFYSPTWESGVSSAVVNIASEVGLMTVDLSGKAIQSETYIEIDGEEEIDISFNDGHTGYAQEQTFKVMARIYYMKDGDETVYSEPLRSNVTLSIDYQGASCPFAVSPRTITPAQAYEGIPVTVKYYPKDCTEPVSTGKITLSTQGYDILSNPYGYDWPVVNLYCAHNAEPCIRVSEPSLSFDNWHTGYEASKTVIVSAYHTSGDIELSLDDPSGLFDISDTVIPADSVGKGVPVTVTYYPQQDGQHSATLTLTNPTAKALTVNITGDATSAPCVEVDSTSLSFEEYTGYTQTKTFKLKAYNLTEDITPQMRIISGRNRFTVTPDVISVADAEQKEGATVSVKYSPSVYNNQTSADHSARIIFSSSGENFAELMLNGHSIKSDYFISVDSTSLAFNTTINQSVSKSIKVTIRNDSPYNGGNNGDPLYSWQGDGDGECDDMSGRQLNWRPPSGSLIDSINPIDHLDLMVFRECYAIIEGDDGFELDAPKFYYKKIEKEVYTICGLIFYMSQHQITDTVSVIFNPKDSKKLTRNARVTFYAPSSKPITVTLTGTVEINVQQGDVNGDSNVTIADVTSLIDYLLSGDSTGISLENADCNGDGSVTIVDVTALIDYLLSGEW